MKKILLTATVIFFTISQATAQVNKQADAAPNYEIQKSEAADPIKSVPKIVDFPSNKGVEKDYAYYLQKKNNHLTAGIVTLSAGLVFSGIGWIITSNSKSVENEDFGAIFLVAGATFGIASIPLMAIAHGYGSKARLALSNQKTGFGVPAKVSRNITGLTIAIPLGK